MAMHVNDSKLISAVELISEKGFAGMCEAMQVLLNEAMRVERNRYLQADHYERKTERISYANGFKPKHLKTQIGELSLSVPQTRDGNFYPSFLEKGIRSERAFKIALAEMYVHGVSTRKVNDILEELCGFQVTSTEVSRASKLLDDELAEWKKRPLGRYHYLWVDARYEKVRQGGCVIDCAVLVAYGVDERGKRDILGLSVSLSEAEIHWRTFFESLVSRGLNGLKLITSDAHGGLKAALKTVFPSVPWQRCQFHLQQNAQAYVTKKSKKGEVAESIRAIFNAENLTEAERMLKLSISKYEKEMPQLAAWMEKNISEGLTVFNFPAVHRKRLRTSNIAERINQEMRRRTQIVRVFPNTQACERLIGAILMETYEGWQTDCVYLTVQ
jgi:putative transposase